MYKFMTIFFGILLIIIGCTNQETSVKLEPGTAAYDLAKTLADSLAFLDPDDNNIVVKTKQFNITTGDIIQSLQIMYGNDTESLKQMDHLRLKDIIDGNARGLAEQKLLYHAARRAHISVSSTALDSVLNIKYRQAGGEERFRKRLIANGVDFESVRNEFMIGLTINQYLSQNVIGEIEISEAEIKKQYEAYCNDTTITASHILLSTQKKSDTEKMQIKKRLESILQRARKGEDFSELIKRYSDYPGSDQQEQLYRDIHRGDMIKSFEDAAFRTSIGEVSEIVETRLGYHIIKVFDKHVPAESLEEIRPKLEAEIRRHKQSEIIPEHIAELKIQAEFEILTF